MALSIGGARSGVALLFIALVRQGWLARAVRRISSGRADCPLSFPCLSKLQLPVRRVKLPVKQLAVTWASHYLRIMETIVLVPTRFQLLELLEKHEMSQRELA